MIGPGSRGPDVVALQTRLAAGGYYTGAIDGIFGPKTAAAVVAEHDGGFRVPPPPFPAMIPQERAKLFGFYNWSPKPADTPGQDIRILDDWEDINIVNVHVPQLVGIDIGGTRSKGNMRFHRLAVPQLLKLWSAWEAAGLLQRILTFDGGFNARYIRGSYTSLSNHAFGTAFDINAEWNMLNHTPAPLGSRGCVLELVQLAHECGFFWGGQFTRQDGMHFEVGRLLS